jgi:hypothetical protein
MGVANAHFPVRANPQLDLYTRASLGLVRVSVAFTGARVGDDDDIHTDPVSGSGSARAIDWRRASG